MHEMSIAQSLLDIVLEESRKHDLASVRVVRLQIGAMAGVVPEALTFCFELLTRDTLASHRGLFWRSRPPPSSLDAPAVRGSSRWKTGSFCVPIAEILCWNW